MRGDCGLRAWKEDADKSMLRRRLWSAGLPGEALGMRAIDGGEQGVASSGEKEAFAEGSGAETHRVGDLVASGAGATMVPELWKKGLIFSWMGPASL